MENLLYIAAIVAAIAFLILCISLAKTLSLIEENITKCFWNNGWADYPT